MLIQDVTAFSRQASGLAFSGRLALCFPHQLAISRPHTSPYHHWPRVAICPGQRRQVLYVNDAAGRLVAVIDPASDAAEYHYDAVGNISRSTVIRPPNSLIAVYPNKSDPKAKRNCKQHVARRSNPSGEGK